MFIQVSRQTDWDYHWSTSHKGHHYYDNDISHKHVRVRANKFIDKQLEEMEEDKILTSMEEDERRYGCSEYDCYEDIYWEGNQEPVRLTYRLF